MAPRGRRLSGDSAHGAASSSVTTAQPVEIRRSGRRSTLNGAVGTAHGAGSSAAPACADDARAGVASFGVVARAVVVSLALAVVLTPISSGGGAASAWDAVALQACVIRWNWMHYGGWFVPSGHVRSEPARVRADPCHIDIAYRFRRGSPQNKHYLGLYFPCGLNRFGAYVCASHTYGVPDGRPLRGLNARYFASNGRIVLDHPPGRPVVPVKPEWVRRYPVDHGFIVPFDRRGRLRRGLTVAPARPLPCSTAPDDRRWPYLWGCGGTMLCFAPSRPPHAGELLMCPTEPGSRRFFRASYRPGLP